MPDDSRASRAELGTVDHPLLNLVATYVGYGWRPQANICRILVVRLTKPLERVLRVFLADTSARHYGYDLMKAARLQSGTLYPLLGRLEDQGLVTSEWAVPSGDAGGRPPRKYYQLTGEGVGVARLEIARAASTSGRRTEGRATPGARERGTTATRERAVTRDFRAPRIASYIIRRASRRINEDFRDEHYREWMAELPAIHDDPDVRSNFIRSVRILSYAAGLLGSARRINPADRDRAKAASRVDRPTWAYRSARRPVTGPRLPPGVLPPVAGFVAWLCLVLVVRSHPLTGSWNLVYVAISAADALFVAVSEVRLVRWLRRRSRQRHRL